MLDSRLEHNLHIFVNSVEFIAKVIDLAKLTPEQVKVVCSVSGDNGENNQRKLGKDYPIGQPSDPVRKINFYTSTCFEGCDLYDKNGVTFIVSDGNKSHTLLDISTLFTQICGRLRDSKYKGEIIHVYSTTKYSRDVTLDEFVASTKKVLAEAVSYADEINKLSGESSGGSSADIAPDFSFMDSISDRLKNIAKDVALIGAGFALWKISEKLPGMLGDIGTKVAGIAIAIGGLLLLFDGLKDAWENGVDWGNLTEILAGAAAAAFGLYTAFGKVGAGIALIISGAAMIVTAFKDIISNGANLKNTLLLIAGIVATGLGFFFLTGSVIPLVIAGIAAVVVAVLGLTGNLEEFCQNFKENILGGLIDFITGVFTGDWTKAWEGIKKVFKGIWNGIVMILESAVNLIIKGVNWLIGKLNSLLENSLLAKGLDLIGIEFRGIPQIPEVHIPRLAQGAVIPPNREFMAVLGDQKSGTNIETPLATMVQAFKRALAESGYSGSNEAVLVLDKDVLGKVVYRLNKAEGTRIGVNLAEI